VAGIRTRADNGPLWKTGEVQDEDFEMGITIGMTLRQSNTNSLRVCCNVGRPWHTHLAHWSAKL